MVPVPAGNLIHMWYLNMPIHSLHRKHSSLSGRFVYYALIFNALIGDCRRVKGKELLQELIFRKCIKVQTKLEFLWCVWRKENLSREILKSRVRVFRRITLAAVEDTCNQLENETAASASSVRTGDRSQLAELYCSNMFSMSAPPALMQHLPLLVPSQFAGYPPGQSLTDVQPDRAGLSAAERVHKKGLILHSKQQQLFCCRKWPKSVSLLLCSWDLSAVVIKSQKRGWQKSDD